MKRRDFLFGTSATAFSLALARPWHLDCSLSPQGNRLVLVELTGGNDGLNMVCPRDHVRLRELRPTLFIPKDKQLPLTEDLALHTNMKGLANLFGKGRLSVINNVGYLPPNRSHFRSRDIWHSGVSKTKETQRGWLGQVLAEDRLKSQKRHVNIFHLGQGPSPLCFAGAPYPVTSLQSLSDLKFGGSELDRKQIEKMSHSKPRESSNLEFLRKSTKSALGAARAVASVKKVESKAFSKDPFGKQMALVASLASAFAGDQIFFTQIAGFDTHALQNETQPVLLASLDRGLTALLRALPNTKNSTTTILVYSEFGRRVRENASRGTDHGAAGPCLLLGNKVIGGIHGGPVNLASLMDGDLRPTTDFRTVYKEVVAGTLGLAARSLQPEFGTKLELMRRT